MDWPAGLKLNTELALFLGDLFLWVIDLWKGGTPPCAALVPYTDIYRMCDWATTFVASCHILHWLLQFRRSHHAHLHVFRPFVTTDCTYILLLHGIGSYISLAAHHHNVSFPPLQRQKAQRATKSNRFMRLRPGPIASGNHTVHFVVLLAANRGSLLPHIHLRQDGDNLSQGGVGHVAGLSEPFPSFCIDASSKGFTASSWSVSFLPCGAEYKPDRVLGGICFELRDTPSVSPPSHDPNDTPETSYIMLKVRGFPSLPSSEPR